MHVAQNRFVTLDYRVTDTAGAVVDKGASPLRYLHGGYDDIFPLLEQALDGKDEGDTIQVTLAAADAFGAVDPTLRRVVARDDIPRRPRIGATIDMEAADGSGRVRYRIVEVTADGKVVLDANHPLAGRDIVFSATVAQVRPAGPLDIAAYEKKARAAIGGRESPRWLSIDWSSLMIGRMPLRLRFHSQTHRLVWLGPLLLLPALGGWLGVSGREDAAVGVGFGWLAWGVLGCPLIGAAIGRWGEKFWFFDFSRNTAPTVWEQRIATTGAVIPVLAGIAVLGLALFRGHGLSDMLTGVGVALAVALGVGIPCILLVPFLIIVLTAFRVRPVVDDGPAGE